jgi:tetratricopeptide (TPR) repeat protein
LADLEEARKCLAGEDSALIWEWELRRAEFAWWVDGDAEQAMQHLAQVPPDLRGPQVPPLGLFLRAALGEQAGVLTEIEVLEGLHPDNLGVRILHGDCLARLQAWEPLAAYLESLDENTRQRPEFRHLRGTLLAHTQRLLEAREELERAAGMDSDNLRFVLDAGHACAELGEWERSEAHWQQALRLDEACGEALLELAESRMAVHDRAGALRFLRECLLHHPEAQEAQLRLAQLESH